ncbi:histidine--tRNA ligase [Candidatus Pacearchaeota archaeon]|nr:histidine--tRNA ligase [Candidatus Pacearchaeota archaeon]
MKTDLVKGFKDYLGEEANKKVEIKKILRSIFERFGFEPVETPIIEYEEFVKGENDKDGAVSDIFKLKDKGKRNLALRYELTFPLKRIMKNQKLPYKTYRIGEVFRDEPVSGNRVRQFTSCDADIMGIQNIKEEAEIFSLVKTIMENLNIKFTIYVNNRKLLNEILNEQKIKKSGEVLKILDKLDKKSEKEVKGELKKYGAEKIINILQKPETYFKKYQSYKEIEELKKYCKYYGVKIKFLPNLTRGLSYYDGTIFEVKSSIKETILGGGSYTFNNARSIGFGVGVERLSAVSNISNKKEETLVISLNQDKDAIKLVEKLREQGKNASIFYGKPSKALEYANSKKIGKVIFVGKKEIETGKFKVKDMETGNESVLIG